MRLGFIRWPLRIVGWGLGAVGIASVGLAAMVATPLRQPPELPSITKGVRKVDFSDLPALQRVQARDGTELAYRVYDPAAGGDARIAVLVHGSAGSSVNMHALGKALAAAGVRSIAIDTRGHGRSGTRGDIAYFGQLDDDLADVVAEIRTTWPTAPLTLIGHSAGGGFALRAAGSVNGDLFDRYVLLAPFLDPFAPTTRPSDGRSAWAAPDLPRIIALSLLQRVGINCCDQLPAVAFALPPGSAKRATGRYSYRLLQNFGTGMSYKPYLAAARHPITVVAGSDDELMDSARYPEAMQRQGLDVKTVIVPGVDHMGIVSDQPALAAIVAAVKP